MLNLLKNIFDNQNSTTDIKSENYVLDILCGLMIETANTDGTVDDVELYIQDQDRSDHPNGMTVVGTVPRTPVVDGAELMAYGPFDNGHLQQAYDSSLDYGTGDFYYMIWINLSGHSPLQGIWSRQDQGQGHQCG